MNRLAELAIEGQDPKRPARQRRVMPTVVATIALGVSLASQQVPSPVFKSNVNVVTLDVRVVDAQGRFVSDLGQEDVQIFENGVEQHVAAFELVNLPIMPDERPLFTGQAVDSDVASNAGVGSDAGAPEGRLYVLLLDDLHTSPMRSADVRAQARDFIEHHFAETDRAVVLMTSGHATAQEFTNSRQRLLRSIDQFEGSFSTDIPLGCNANLVTDPAFCATANERLAMQALSDVAMWLAPIGGRRKALLVFGEGMTRVAPNDAGVDALALSDAMDKDVQEAVGSAARANMTVYPVDPRLNAGALFTRVVADTSSYYLIGYVPTNDKRDGTFRKVDVRTRRPGLTVQARTGYTARSDAPQKRTPPAGVSPALAELMATSLATSGLTMSVSAPVFRGTGSKASVELIVDVSGRDLTLTSDAERGSLELLAAVADASGQIQATERGSLKISSSPATRTAVIEHGLRVLSRLDVPPGRYLLRVAGVDGGGIARGSVQYDLDVPDFANGLLTMSSLALACRSESQRPTTGSDKAWNQRFGDPPTTVRAFAVGDELLVSGEIYRNDKQAGDIDITTRVEGESGEILFRHQERLAVAKATSSAFRHQTAISLQTLLPGAYLLTVDARSPLNPKAVASRQIPFTVQQSVRRLVH
jgi:VWFA-related protein